MAQLVKNPPAMWETGFNLSWEDPLEKGKATQLQYSGLENSIDRKVHGVANSQTRLSDFHFHTLKSEIICSNLGNIFRKFSLSLVLKYSTKSDYKQLKLWINTESYILCRQKVTAANMNEAGLLRLFNISAKCFTFITFIRLGAKPCTY